MRTIIWTIVGIIVLASLVDALRPRRSRIIDPIGDAIDREGYSGLFERLDVLIDRYASNHFGVIPDSLETICVEGLPSLFAPHYSTAEKYAKAAACTVVKPLYKDDKGIIHAYLLAALIPKGPSFPNEVVYLGFGPSDNRSYCDHAWKSAADFERQFGAALLRELQQKRSRPSDLRVEQRGWPRTVPGEEQPIRNDDRRFCVFSRLDLSRATEETTSRKVWESRTIAAHRRPVTFTTGAWEPTHERDVPVSSKYGNFTISAKPSDGSAGDDTIRLSLKTLRDGVISMSVSTSRGNTTKVIHFRLSDSSGRIAQWDFDLSLAKPNTVIHPIGNATLSKPNVPPTDGKRLNLSQIVKWEIAGSGDSSEVFFMQISPITIEGPRVSD